jgi:hypothetical protein
MKELMREMQQRSMPLPWVASEPLSKKVVRSSNHSVPKAFTSQFVLGEPQKSKKKSPSSKWIAQIWIEVSENGVPELLKFSISGSTKELITPPDWILNRYPSDLQAIDTVQISEFNSIKRRLITLAMVDVATNWKPGKNGQSWERDFRIKLMNISSQKDFKKKIDKQIHQKLNDDFLYEVARIYLQAKSDGLFPNRTLSIYFSKPKKTVERWVSECRKKGFLDPIRKGKVKEGK